MRAGQLFLFIILFLRPTATSADSQVTYSLAFGEVDGSAALVDSVPPGSSVVLVGLEDHRVQAGRTGATYSLAGTGYWDFTATQLVGASLQFYYSFALAVVGTTLERVKLVSPGHASARDLGELSRAAIDAACTGLPLFYANGDTAATLARYFSPQVLTTGRASLLIYTLHIDDTLEKHGPTVLCLEKSVTRLPGTCTANHTFFSQDGNLFFTYVAVGCGSGEYTVYVYDLSGKNPVLVYHDSSLST